MKFNGVRSQPSLLSLQPLDKYQTLQKLKMSVVLMFRNQSY